MFQSRNYSRFVLFATLCVFLLAGIAYAQQANGTITGTIVDSSGATIAESKVTLTNEATGETFTVEAQWMVACDGVGSGIAQSLGIGYQGKANLSYSVNAVIRCPTIMKFHDKGEAERILFLGPEGTWSNMTVIDGRELIRFTLIGSEAKLFSLSGSSLVVSPYRDEKARIVGVLPRVAHVAVVIHRDDEPAVVVVDAAPVRRPLHALPIEMTLARNLRALVEAEQYVEQRVAVRDVDDRSSGQHVGDRGAERRPLVLTVEIVDDEKLGIQRKIHEFCPGPGA